MQGLDTTLGEQTIGRARVQAATVRVRDAYVAERFGEDGRETYRREASSALRELLTCTQWLGPTAPNGGTYSLEVKSAPPSLPPLPPPPAPAQWADIELS